VKGRVKDRVRDRDKSGHSRAARHTLRQHAHEHEVEHEVTPTDGHCAAASVLVCSAVPLVGSVIGHAGSGWLDLIAATVVAVGGGGGQTGQ
jgi:hypothetical protein